MEFVAKLYDWLVLILDSAELLPDFASPRGIFCVIAWTGTLLSLASVALSLFTGFGDSDIDVPATESADAADGDTGIFSVRALIGFMMGFGWGGYAAVQSGASVWIAVLVGMLTGLVIFILVVLLLRFIYSLQTDGTMDENTLVGKTGSVYVTLPPNGEMGGQVQISHPSGYVTKAAVQMGTEPMPAQTPVVVEKVLPGYVVVTPLVVSSTSKPN